MTNPIAIHEASHAAVYLLIGSKDAQIIELQVNDDSSGRCLFRSRIAPVPAAMLAGYVGEMRVLDGRDWRPTPDDLAANLHLRDIADAAALVGIDGLPKLWDETAEMIDGQWDRIEAIAEALSAARRLPGDAVEAIWLRYQVMQTEKAAHRHELNMRFPNEAHHLIDSPL